MLSWWFKPISLWKKVDTGDIINISVPLIETLSKSIEMKKIEWSVLNNDPIFKDERSTISIRESILSDWFNSSNWLKSFSCSRWMIALDVSCLSPAELFVDESKAFWFDKYKSSISLIYPFSTEYIIYIRVK